MANRNLVNFRRVAEVAVREKDPSIQVGQEVVNVLSQRASEAELAKTFSQTQLEVQRLKQEFSVDVQDNPQEALRTFKNKRGELFDQKQADLPAPLRSAFAATRRRFEAEDDLSANDTVFKQQQINAVRDVNEAIGSQLQIAQELGANFNGDLDAFDIVKNAEFAAETAVNPAVGLVGENKSEDFKKSFKSDYFKSFLSGAVNANPEGARELLKDPAVKDTLTSKEIGQFRDAIIETATNFQEQQEEIGIYNNIGRVNDILAQGRAPGLAAVEQSMVGLPDDVQNFIRKELGFKAKDKTKLTDTQKLELENQLSAKALSILGGDASAQSLLELQEQVIDARDKGAITKTEFDGFMNDIAVPLAERRKEQVQAVLGSASGESKEPSFFNLFNAFGSKTDRIKSVFNKLVVGEDAQLFNLDKIEDKDKKVRFKALAEAKVESTFFSELKKEAASRGLELSDVAFLSQDEREDFAETAQTRTMNVLIRKFDGVQQDNAPLAEAELSRRINKERNAFVQDRIDSEIEAQDVDPEVDKFFSELGVFE